jgi:putative transposase
MARQPRDIRPGVFYHVLNRSAGRIALFRRESDYAAFERIMIEAAERFPLRIVDWCLMPNHWHFMVWPRKAEEVTDYFRWLTHTHAMRWRVAHRSVGWGHLYQGRFKAFAVEEGGPLRMVRRYVQRQALSAELVKRAELWRWASLWARREGSEELKGLLSDESPRLVGGTGDWLEWVNEPLMKRELERLRVSVARGRPYGSAAWVERAVKEMGLEHTVRAEGRPRKAVGGLRA